MGTVGTWGEMAKESRWRLSNRIRELLASAPQGDFSSDAKLIAFECTLGVMVHTESMLTYTTAVVPPEMQPAPWLWVIGKLAEEEATPFARLRGDLRKCVEVYLENLRSPRDSRAILG